MNQLQNYCKKISKTRLFLLIVGLNLLISVVYLLATRGAVLDEYVGLRGIDNYMDFFNHIRYVEDPANTYYVIKDACFPPFAYIFYLFLNRLLPSDQAVGNTWGLLHAHALLLYILYCVVLSVLLYYVFLKISKKLSADSLFLITVSVLISTVFVHGIFARGNSAFIVAIMLLAFYVLKDSPSKIKRELALILLAMATGFKVYPAIFGVVYLGEKRYKEAARLILYGAVIFFLPFAFFGGFDGFIQFLRNQMAVHDNLVGSMQSIHAVFRLYVSNVTVADNISGIMRVAFFAFSIAIAGWSRIDAYKRYYLLSAAMIIVPAWSGGYTRAYLLLPLVLLLNSDSETWQEKVYAALFGILFSLMTYNAKISGVIIGEYLAYFAMYALTLVFVIQGIIDLVRIMKDKFKKQEEKELTNE